MKKKKVIKINFSNKLFYTFIVIGILAIVGVGVYAAYPSSGAGHNVNEIDFSEGIDGNLIVNGKIGIGTDNPSQPLEISNNAPYINWVEEDSGNKNWIAGILNGDFKILEDGTTTRFIIKEGGNIGIGTTSPSAELDVDGKIKTDELCFGSDCRDSWFSNGRIAAGVWHDSISATQNDWYDKINPLIPSINDNLIVSGSMALNGVSYDISFIKKISTYQIRIYFMYPNGNTGFKVCQDGNAGLVSDHVSLAW